MRRTNTANTRGVISTNHPTTTTAAATPRTRNKSTKEATENITNITPRQDTADVMRYAETHASSEVSTLSAVYRCGGEETVLEVSRDYTIVAQPKTTCARFPSSREKKKKVTTFSVIGRSLFDGCFFGATGSQVRGRR